MSEEIDTCSNFTHGNKKIVYRRFTPESVNWPKTWSGCCLNDGHPFDSIPIPVVRKDPLGNPNVIRRTDFVGWFCSPNCMKYYLLRIGNPRAFETLMHMKIILRQYLGIDEEYAPAHPIEMLDKYHPMGPEYGLTIEQYRAAHIFKQAFIKTPPMIVNSIVIQECEPFRNQFIKNSLLFAATANLASQQHQSKIDDQNGIESSSTSKQQQHVTDVDPEIVIQNREPDPVIPKEVAQPVTLFDEFYQKYTEQHGPPPPLTNPTGKPKKPRASPAKKRPRATMESSVEPELQDIPELESIVANDETVKKSKPPATKRPRKTTKKQSKSNTSDTNLLDETSITNVDN